MPASSSPPPSGWTCRKSSRWKSTVWSAVEPNASWASVPKVSEEPKAKRRVVPVPTFCSTRAW